jgi:cold shock CspA family protein
MARGIVREFDSERGMGVIEEDSGGEILVFRSGLGEDGLRVLYRGDVVEYRVGRSRRGGRAALNVVRIGWEDEADDENPREWTF